MDEHSTCSAWHIDAVLPFQEESISTVRANAEVRVFDWPKEEVDDWDKSDPAVVSATPRRSTSSLGVTMSIRDVLEKRRRILIAVGVGALLALFLCVSISRRFCFLRGGLSEYRFAQMPSLS